MKDYAHILIFLVVFISLFGKTYASVDSFSIVSGKDTTECISLYFKEDQENLDEYFANNMQSLMTLDSLMRQFSDVDNSLEWEIKSYACFKGSTEYNHKLAILRAESVKDFLQKRYLNIDIQKVKCSSGGENWSEFRTLVMTDTNFPDKEEILLLIDYHSNDVVRRKELIKKLDRGIPYRYIAQNVWPKLRRAEITITWKNAEKTEVSAETPEVTISDSNLVNDIGQVENEKNNELGPVISSVDEVEKREESQNTVLAIKNNLLYDLALAPNIEVEIPIGKRWSLNTEYKCPWWMNSRDNFCYQLLSGGVEARFWLGNRQKRNKLTGHFLGVYAEGGVYDFQFSDESGYQGKYYGASGVTYGYALQLARHFSMEFSLGVGYLATEYKKYVPYEEDIVKTTSGRYNFIGPTKLKVSLVWLLTKGR